MQITLKSKSLCPEVPEMKTKTSFHCESPTKVTSRDIRVRTQVIPRHSGSPHFPQAALAGTAGCRIQHRVASALTASRGRPCSQEPRGMGRGQAACSRPPPGPPCREPTLTATDTTRAPFAGDTEPEPSVRLAGCPCPTAGRRCRHSDTLSDAGEHLCSALVPKASTRPPTPGGEQAADPPRAQAGPGRGRGAGAGEAGGFFS